MKNDFITKIIAIMAVTYLLFYLLFILDIHPHEYPKSGENLKFLASEEVSTAKVYTTNEGGQKKCTKSKIDDIWYCSKFYWNYVGKTTKKMGGALQECIWFHPVRGKTLYIQYDKLEHNSNLEGFFGLTRGSDVKNPGIVQFKIQSDDKLLFEENISKEGVNKFEIPQIGKDLVFSVSVDNPKKRMFCFNAWIS